MFTTYFMFVVYDHNGKPRGRGESSGQALNEAVTKACRDTPRNEHRAAWERLKAIGWSLQEHKRTPTSASEQK